MMRFIISTSIFLNFVFTNCAAQEPRRITDDEIAPAVWGVLEQPVLAGPRPSVILLPGSRGWRPEYAQIAEDFADSGFIALALDYYAETGRDTSQEDKRTKWPIWQKTVRSAVEFLQSSESVSGIGIVGYSRGAFLAVSVASTTPGVLAIVDFFGGGGSMAPLDEEVEHFPPLLIFHGEMDNVVPVRFAYQLRDAVIAQGGVVEMHIYPGGGHAFNATWNPAFSEPETTDSWKHTIRFLRQYLMK